jgi:hypothetical protein
MKLVNGLAISYNTNNINNTNNTNNINNTNNTNNKYKVVDREKYIEICTHYVLIIIYFILYL